MWWSILFPSNAGAIACIQPCKTELRRLYTCTTTTMRCRSAKSQLLANSTPVCSTGLKLMHAFE